MDQKHSLDLPGAHNLLSFFVRKGKKAKIKQGITGNQQNHQIFGCFNDNIGHNIPLFCSPLDMASGKFCKGHLRLPAVKEAIGEGL